MDSINQNQPESTRENLLSTAAIQKIKELADDAKSCFFCTKNGIGESMGIRPMSIQKVDDNGVMWFFSAADSHKNVEIELDPKVSLFFQGSAHAGFLHLTGIASISKDKSQIDELWDPMVKVWFTEGKDDPRITLIKVEPDYGYYWDNKHGSFVAGVKMMAGVVMGKTLDDSIEGSLQV